jgi:hypothetical protein
LVLLEKSPAKSLLERARKEKVTMTLSRFPSLVAIAAALSIGALTAAPPALAQRTQAQQRQAQQQPQQQGAGLSSKELAKTVQEGYTALQAKDFATAKVKLDAAWGLAKTPNDKVEIEKLRVPMASETKDWTNLIVYLQNALDTGLLPAETAKAYKFGFVTAYANLKDNPKTAAALRAYVDEFGGTPDQLFAVGNELVKANDPAGVGYVEKAMAATKAAGAKPTEGQHLLLLAAYAKDEAKYFDALGPLVADYPTDNNWKRYIARAQNAPGFAASKDIRIDIYRAAMAAGVKLSQNELAQYADETVNKGLPGEAVSALEPVKAELSGPAQATLANAHKKAAEDKAGLAKDEANTRAKGTGEAIANLGEAYMTYGDNAKAVELMKAGLAKGIPDAGKADIVKLHLGIAQNKSGDKAGAQATWAEVKADNGAAVLAKMWTTISKVKG